MKWGGEFRAADRGLGILLSGKVQGTFDGELSSQHWARLRVVIINAFNDAISGARDSVAQFDDLEALSRQVTLAIGSELKVLGASGEVHIEVAALDPAVRELVAQRRAAGPVAPDAFLLGATAGPPPPMPPPLAEPVRSTPMLVPGSRALVHWQDGHRYPVLVLQVRDGEYLLSLGDGREIWVAAEWVSAA